MRNDRHMEDNVRQFYRSTRRVLPILALALAAALSPVPVQAQDPYPLRPDGAPPVNIGVDDAMALLEGSVLVTRLSAPEPGRDGGVKLRIHHYAQSGRLHGCGFGPGGRYGTTGEPWIHGSMTLPDTRRDLHIPVVVQVAEPDTAPTFSAVHHDAVTGVTVLFMRDLTGSWYPRETGHLQDRLPAAVYELCPDFPPAEDLGLDINTAQTGLTYPELVAQDPGRRVLRPDLVSFDAIEAAQ